MLNMKQLTLMLPVLGLIGCGTGRSSDVKQSTIEQTYQVTYSEATAQIKATAEFRYENTLGTSLKLTGNSSIAFNGSPMNYSNVLNTASYHLETQPIHNPKGVQEFRYVNNDGEAFVTQTFIPAATAITLPHDGDHLSGDRELQIMMQGEPIVGTDDVTLCLTYEPASTAEREVRECLHSEGPMSLVFSREQLSRFPLDQELKLDIKRESHPAQSNPRIHVTQTFLSRPLYITLQ